jgi:hypothetical protein
MRNKRVLSSAQIVNLFLFQVSLKLAAKADYETGHPTQTQTNIAEQNIKTNPRMDGHFADYLTCNPALLTNPLD